MLEYRRGFFAKIFTCEAAKKPSLLAKNRPGEIVFSLQPVGRKTPRYVSFHTNTDDAFHFHRICIQHFCRNHYQIGRRQFREQTILMHASSTIYGEERLVNEI